MILGDVIGQIHSTVNHPFYTGRKMLVIEKVDPCGAGSTGYLIAVDVVDAGLGDRVLVLDEGNGARQVLSSEGAPVRSVVVGVVDRVHVHV